MSTRTEKIMQSMLYQSGSAFKLSDICGRVHLSARNTKAVLDDMVKDSLLIVDESQKTPTYRRPARSNDLVSKKWVSFIPPKPANQQYLNPWTVR